MIQSTSLVVHVWNVGLLDQEEAGVEGKRIAQLR